MKLDTPALIVVTSVLGLLAVLALAWMGKATGGAVWLLLAAFLILTAGCFVAGLRLYRRLAR